VAVASAVRAADRSDGCCQERFPESVRDYRRSAWAGATETGVEPELCSPQVPRVAAVEWQAAGQDAQRWAGQERGEPKVPRVALRLEQRQPLAAQKISATTRKQLA
jgi:hypothetical protein